MPTVAIVEGVKIQFYFDEHPPPHFHAVFAEFVAQIQIDPLPDHPWVDSTAEACGGARLGIEEP